MNDKSEVLRVLRPAEKKIATIDDLYSIRPMDGEYNEALATGSARQRRRAIFCLIGPMGTPIYIGDELDCQVTLKAIREAFLTGVDAGKTGRITLGRFSK